MLSSTCRSATKQAGVTLIELMVVVGIIGFLMVAAVTSIQTSSYAGSVQGFADTIVGQIDTARMRATTRRRWQRLQISATTIIHEEANAPGMGTAPGFDTVQTINVPADVSIVSVDGTTHIAQNTSVPAIGAGLPGVLLIKPDGSSQPKSLFIRDDFDKDRYRVIVYGASGTAYAYQGW